MKVKKYLVIILVFFIGWTLWAEQIIDTGVFIHDKTVNNAFIGQYTFGAAPDIFSDFFAIDTASYQQGGFVYGIGADKYKNLFYYFDFNKKSEYFGINQDTGERALKLVDKVAATKSGKFYAIDCITEEIYYWDIKGSTFLPEGKIDKIFENLEDIYCDNEVLFILDNKSREIFKYSVTENQFLQFDYQNEQSFQYSAVITSSWGNARGVIAADNFIFIVFERGKLLKLSRDGRPIGMFSVDRDNINLFSLREKYNSELWWESIAIGPYGNIYILDTKDKKIHILNENLEYISSWEDPSHALEDKATDICFIKSYDSLLTSHSWGFYTHQLSPKLAGISCEDKFIYPQYINEEYKGLEIDLSVIGSGFLDIAIEKNGVETDLLDNHYLDYNERFKFVWDGKDKAGDTLSYGSYTVKFYLNDHADSELLIEIRMGPEILLFNSANNVIDSDNLTVLYNYSVSDGGIIGISLWEDNELKSFIDKTQVSEGSYAFSINEDIIGEQLDEGYYQVNLEIVPFELQYYSSIGDSKKSTFLVNKEELSLGLIENQSTGFNPTNQNLAEMNASFFISEGAFITAEILDINFNVVSALFSDIYYGAGDNTLIWNGKDNDSSYVNDGQYKFSLTAKQTEIGVSLSETGELFELDTTAPVIDCNISQIDINGQSVIFSGTDNYIYISNDEDSSVGVKDNFTASVSYNEAVVFSTDIYSGSDLTRTIIGEAFLADNESINSYWDGIDNLGSGVEDGLYFMRIQAEDEYGNLSLKNVRVWIDNNRLEEAIEKNVIGAESIPIDFSSIKQYDPSITEIDNGYVIAWREDSVIYVQCFDETGVPSTLKSSVDENPNGDFSVVRIESGFVIVWEKSQFWYPGGHISITNTSIYAQIFNTNGQKVGVTFPVATSSSLSSNYDIGLSSLDNGFIISWMYHEFESYAPPWGGIDYRIVNNTIFAQNYDSSGNLKGNRIQINEHIGPKNGHSSISELTNGFIITWESQQSNNTYNIVAQLFDVNRVKVGNEFLVNTYTQGSQRYPVVESKDDSFFIVWQSNDPSHSGIFGQIYNSQGNILGGEILVNSQDDEYFSQPELSNIAEGYLVLWTGKLESDDNVTIIGQLCDFDGGMFGSNFIINSSDSNQSNPAAANLVNGFGVVYQQENRAWFRRFAFYSATEGLNLTTQFLPPFENDVISAINFNINAFVSDAYFDKYSLSIISESDIKVVLNEDSKTASGDLYYFNIFDIPEGSTAPVTLEAWDKAGNYRSDSFELTRDYSDGVITDFRIENSYCSALQPLTVDYSLTESSAAVLTIKDGTAIIRQFNQPVGEEIDDLMLDTTGLADGNYTLELSTEILGSSYSMDLDFILDNTEPLITFGDFNSYLSSQENQSIPSEIEEINLASFTLTLLDNTGTPVEILGEGNSISDLETVMFNPINFVEGNYSFVLSAHDRSGNSSNTSVDIIVDRTAPVVTFSSPDFTLVQQGSINIEGTVSDIGGFSDYIINFNREAEPSLEIMTGNTEDISFTWITSGFINPILKGDLSCTLTDLAGNSSVINFPLIIDNNPPSVELKSVEQPFLIEDDQYINGNNLLYFTAQSNDPYSTVEEINYRINEEVWTVYTDTFSLENEGTYVIEYFAVDSFGNSSEILNRSYLVDSSAPVCELSIDMPKFFDNGITYIPFENRINLSSTDGDSEFSSGVAGTEYRINDGNWKLYEGSLIIYQEGPVVIRTKVSDNVGNSREEDAVELVVDLAPPATQYEIDSEYYQSFQRNIIALKLESSITLSAEDLGYEEYTSGVNSTFIVQDGVETEYSEPVILSSTIPAEYSFYSIDNVGNRENEDPILIAIDNEVPVINCIIPDGAYVKDDQVYVLGGSAFRLTAEDNFAGIRDIMFGFDGIEYSQYSDSLVWENEEDIDFYYYAEDNIGLTSEIKSMSIIIDNTAPATIILKNLSLIEIDGVLYADDRYEFSFQAVDARSGVYETFISIDGSKIIDFPFVFTDEGEHSITYYSVDNLGNSEQENELTIVTPIPDITPPVSTLSQSYPPWEGDGMDYFKSTVEFTLSAEDILGQYDSFASGVDTVFYRLDGSPYLEYISGSKITFTEEGLHSIYYYAADLAGNTELVNDYYFTIDDSAPVTHLGFDSNNFLEIDDVLYIPESEQINLIAEDTYAGISETYYKLESDGDWSIYEDPFSLFEGAFELSWYSIDNLGNTEGVRTQLFNVTNNYNTLSYSTSFITCINDRVADYDIFGDRMTYLKGRGETHIYLKEPDGHNDVIFSHSKKISARKRERKTVVLGSEWIATVELSSNGQDIFLYNFYDRRQYGIPVTSYGTNRDPVFIGNKLYWIRDDGTYQSICEYDPDLGYVNVLYETLDSIWGLQRNNGLISFIVESNEFQEVYTNSGDLITKVLTREMTEGRFSDYSLYAGILAIETEGSVISVYHRLTYGPVLFFQVNGNKPAVKGNQLYFLETLEDYDLLARYNMTNGVRSNILKGIEISDYMFTGNDSLVVRRNEGAESLLSFIDFFFNRSGFPSGSLDRWLLPNSADELVYLKEELSASLVDDISFVTGDNRFAYNKYLDTEDFIYADEHLVLPQFMLIGQGLHHIQTFNREQDNDDGPYISFTAKEDIVVLVIADNSEAGRFEYLGFRKEYGVLDNRMRGNMGFLNTFRRFSVFSCEVSSGEEFNLNDINTDTFAPIIFILEQDDIR